MADETVEFKWQEDGVEQPLKIYQHASHLRVDTPHRRFSILFDARNGDYIGLEHRDARYWKFNWPKLLSTLDASRKNANQLNSSLVIEPSDKNAASGKGVRDYIWRKAASHKMVEDLPAQLWETTDEYHRRVGLWCTNQSGGPSRELWKMFTLVQETLKLVAIRPLGPGLASAAFDVLPNEAGRPLELSLGDQEDGPRLIFKTRTLEVIDPILFTIGKEYIISPLGAIDGVE